MPRTWHYPVYSATIVTLLMLDVAIHTERHVLINSSRRTWEPILNMAITGAILCIVSTVSTVIGSLRMDASVLNLSVTRLLPLETTYYVLLDTSVRFLIHAPTKTMADSTE